MNFTKVNKFIENLVCDPEMAKNLFRYKGVIAVRGSNRKFVFQGVHMIFSGDFSDEVDFKEGESRESRFVFIGRNINKHELIIGFENCISEDELRFGIGDRVKVFTGSWVEGQVIKLWDKGNP